MLAPLDAGEGGQAPVPDGLAVPGAEARIAPDGSWALVLEGDGAVHTVDLLVAAEAPSGLPQGYVALAGELGADGRVAYVVARAADRPASGEYVRSSFTGAISVLTCQLVTPGAAGAAVRGAGALHRGGPGQRHRRSPAARPLSTRELPRRPVS